MTPRQTLFSSVPPRNPLVSVSDPYWAFSSLQWRLSSALRLEPFVGTGSIEIDALATSTSYAGRRPLHWLACDVARATDSLPSILLHSLQRSLGSLSFTSFTVNIFYNSGSFCQFCAVNAVKNTTRDRSYVQGRPGTSCEFARGPAAIAMLRPRTSLGALRLRLKN